MIKINEQPQRYETWIIRSKWIYYVEKKLSQFEITKKTISAIERGGGIILKNDAVNHLPAELSLKFKAPAELIGTIKKEVLKEFDFEDENHKTFQHPILKITNYFHKDQTLI